MSTGSVAIPRIRGSRSINKVPRPITKARPMKLSLKQKIRNWLLNDDDQYGEAISIDETPNISSNGFRLNIYGASGGTIVETTKYDRKHDENRHSLHVVTDDKNLGEELRGPITAKNVK